MMPEPFDEGFAKVIDETNQFLMSELYGLDWNPPTQHDDSLIPVLNDEGEIVGYRAPDGPDGAAWE